VGRPSNAQASINILVNGIMKELETDVFPVIIEGVEAAVLTSTELLQAKVASNFDVQYSAAMADEANIGDYSKQHFKQENPASAIRAEVLSTSKTGTRVVRVVSKLGDVGALDLVEDRFNSAIVRIPIKANRAPGRVERNDPMATRKGTQYEFRTITVAGRDPKRVGRGHNRGWRLWRAMEYGQLNYNGNMVRVTVPTVRAVRGGGKFISFGPAITFMSPRGDYWRGVLDMEISKIDTPTYWGGYKPVQTAYEEFKYKDNLWNEVVKEVKSRGV
jgi:hypothetical protein